jgi:hypothetical protein
LYRSVEPAWHDRNMKDMSKHIMAPTIRSRPCCFAQRRDRAANQLPSLQVRQVALDAQWRSTWP